MKRPSRAIFEKNANACETAKFPACKCACGGALHGAAHSLAWRRETFQSLEGAYERHCAELARMAANLELFEGLSS